MQNAVDELEPDVRARDAPHRHTFGHIARHVRAGHHHHAPTADVAADVRRHHVRRGCGAVRQRVCRQVRVAGARQRRRARDVVQACARRRREGGRRRRKGRRGGHTDVLLRRHVVTPVQRTSIQGVCTYRLDTLDGRVQHQRRRQHIRGKPTGRTVRGECERLGWRRRIAERKCTGLPRDDVQPEHARARQGQAVANDGRRSGNGRRAAANDVTIDEHG